MCRSSAYTRVCEQAVHAGADVPDLDRAGRGGSARLRDHDRRDADLRWPGQAPGGHAVRGAGPAEGRRPGLQRQGGDRGRAAAPLLPDHRRGHPGTRGRGGPAARQRRGGRQPAGPGRRDHMSEQRARRQRTRMEKRYRRLLALYPKDHRREHAEEMVGVLLAADGDAQVRAPNSVAWALRFGRRTADSADLVGGALRIRGRMVLNHIRRARWFSRTVRDQRWSDALAIVSVVAPLLLLVAALTEFRIPQAMAGSITGHPHWRPTTALSLADLPLAAGAPAVTLLAFLRLRWLAGLGALAAAIGQIAAGAVPAFAGYANPAVAFTVLLSCTAAAALLLSPGPDRGLALLTRSGTALVGAGALILGGFSVGGTVWLSSPSSDITGFGGEVAGLPAPVSRRVLALLAIPVIPYAILWQEKLAGDLLGQSGGAAALIPSSIPLLYLPPLILACVIVAGTRLARRRATGRDRQVGSAPSAGPRGAVSA